MKTPLWVKRRAVKRSKRNCAAKKIFVTVEEAVKFAKDNGLPQRPYPCRVCCNFHLTTIRKED